MHSEDSLLLERVTKAIKQINAGGMVIMVDDEDRENEGDLVAAASKITPSIINFMAKEARGLVCLTLSPNIVERLKLPPMQDSSKSNSPMSTAFTVSIEAKQGVSTGISAHDRAHTIQVAINENSSSDDLVVPGHVFPLRARAGGVLERAGHTEGSVDLAQLAGLTPAAVICEIMNDDGTMARMPDLKKFAKTHQLPILSIADLITYRLLKDSLVEKISHNTLNTRWGTFPATLYKNKLDSRFLLALSNDEHFADKTVEVRVHSQRSLRDIFGRADSLNGSRLLEYGFNLLTQSAPAVFLYIFQTDPSQSIAAEFSAFQLDNTQEASPSSSYKMDYRTIGLGAQVLRGMGVTKMRLHTSSEVAIPALKGYGLEIVDSVIIRSLD